MNSLRILLATLLVAATNPLAAARDIRALMQRVNACQLADPEGRIIDPVEKVEKYYATPCHAHAVAVLAHSGHSKDAGLIESGMKALDAAPADMASNKAPGGHGDFFTWPAMFACSMLAQARQFTASTHNHSCPRARSSSPP